MGLFSKKRNGDYFVKIIETLTETSINVGHLKEGFDDHVKAGRIQRTEDKALQTEILKNSLECARGNQVDGIQKDVNTLNTDKIKREGKFLGIKLVYAVIIGVFGFITIVLGILWKLRII